MKRCNSANCYNTNAA